MNKLNSILRALDDEVQSYEQETRRTVERQIELEQCVYALLKNKKPTPEQYIAVNKRLKGIEKHLRNPALYELSEKRAKS